jgi:hypothetical protein
MDQQPQQSQTTTPKSGRSTRAAATNLTLQVRDNIVDIIMRVIAREYNNTIDTDRLRTIIVAETDPLITVTTTQHQPPRVQDIGAFFKTSSRDQNDASNKVREPVLTILSSPPTEFLAHETYGSQWKQVSDEWNKVMTKIAPQTADTTDTTDTTTTTPHHKIKVELKGGRVFNYDADITFLDGETGATLTKRKAEFKYNAARINELPQFLSLQARYSLFTASPASPASPAIPTYDEFYYTNYLPKYIAIDTGRNPNDPNDIQLALAELPKPPLEEYLNAVTKTDTKDLPFFAQLKEREEILFKKEKSALVDESITQYLTLYGSQIDVSAFTAKLVADQTDKHYILWKNGKFHHDIITQEEMSDLQFRSIKNGNTIVLQSATKPSIEYHLLLRWRNHKGILNPAWQISMRRIRATPVAQ